MENPEKAGYIVDQVLVVNFVNGKDRKPNPD